ncbi:helix-turn-helix domain-containing protein [Mycobacterium avium subsp. hominissuis]|uniref:helix-turn-helix domain-containing protein n=1 Tax=Mycobacterium avium TaxID=1764 RepID=UPI001CC351E7|nr:helix-turn-helix domain-containing protein [Mycobacterium avium]MBZ4558587.1 helix-turn-helix domain-containing protein [Mycobacterium avium subsp. hominissuis]MBZ4569622.1 helix-turn-helix domain-containing protein [Mycobacterium avium subsp. hominissuis]MBZ4587940.1 helix-turn-helix domain-containing protein [Mycobacterium avium subsp. hominissuis]MBZ4625447.1 helix-turn-helix domain-containing protein [Mycobacterium avium subsp. hominissuis]
MLIDDPDELRWLYYCVGAAVRERELHHRHVTPCLRRLFDRADAAMSESGHESACEAEQSEPDVPITAREAADILGLSKRQCQRLAADLDGQLVGGRWQFSRAAVVEYQKGRAHGAA